MTQLERRLSSTNTATLGIHHIIRNPVVKDVTRQQTNKLWGDFQQTILHIHVPEYAGGKITAIGRVGVSGWAGVSGRIVGSGGCKKPFQKKNMRM